MSTENSPLGTVAGLVTSHLHVAEDATISSVAKLWESHTGLDGMAVLGKSHIRFVSRMRFFYQLGQRFGYSLFENRPISLLAEEASVVQADMDPVEVISLATQREPERIYDDLVVVDRDRFVGLVSVRSLLVHHKDLIATGITERAVLEERNRRLQEANRSRSEFTTGLARELRGPVSSMLGVARALIGDPETGARQRAALEALLNRAQSVLGVVDDLQDLLRLEYRELEPVPEELDIVAFLNETVAAAQPTSGPSAGVRATLGPLPNPFVSDPIILRRTVSNVLSAFTKLAGSAAVTFAADSRDRDLCLHFSAPGVVLADAEREALLAHVMGPDAPLRARSGTSLRLATVKGFTERLGGRLEVSDPSAEARISLHIPPLSAAAS